MPTEDRGGRPCGPPRSHRNTARGWCQRVSLDFPAREKPDHGRKSPSHNWPPCLRRRRSVRTRSGSRQATRSRNRLSRTQPMLQARCLARQSAAAGGCRQGRRHRSDRRCAPMPMPHQLLPARIGSRSPLSASGREASWPAAGLCLPEPLEAPEALAASAASKTVISASLRTALATGL